MEECEVYRPNKPKGFYLDPRTKILFMIFITTIMSVGYEDIVIDLQHHAADDCWDFPIFHSNLLLADSPYFIDN